MDISKDIKFGPHTLRIRKQQQGFAGIIVGQSQAPVFAETASEVQQLLLARCGEQARGFVGLKGARSRFIELFPSGFADTKYLGNGKHEGERGYKLIASNLLRERLPMSAVSETADAGLIALKVLQKTNLLDPFSKAKLSEVLRGPRATEFLRIAVGFAEGETVSASATLNRDFRDARVNTWVCLTYFPFLWMPNQHMFLKPDFTRSFAERIGHGFQFDYESTPNAATYNSLLHMTDIVRASVSDLRPEDNIDIHSFMWTTVEYRNSDVGL